MYLKSIEVQGFKSFADKINFEFHNGITGIVGPNGSGKSNVADAVRWVLGEQSAKQLRGGNMQDVIFSGTESRRPLAFASVAITLDNSDHKLPVDYNEVTVTRRLYRSGESEYLMNGSACRLKDILEMFYDTGIGKEGYSIIGQGQIDKILSGKPDDRRELFDEAAGIVKFKRRKNVTLKKLAEEQQNLVRVTDILSELTKQLNPLKNQSEKARTYLSVRDELRKADVNLFLMDQEQNRKTLAELQEKIDISEKQLADQKEAYDRTREEYDRIEQELASLKQKSEDLNQKKQQAELSSQQISGRIDVLMEQIASSEQSALQYNSRLAAIRQDTEKRKDEQDTLQEEKSVLKHEIKNISRDQQKEEENLYKIHTETEDCSNSVEEGKNEIIEILNARATTKGQAQRFETMKEQANLQEAEINRRILELESSEEELKSAIDSAREAYKVCSDEIVRINHEIADLNEKAGALQSAINRQNQELESAQKNFHTESSRLESLKNLAERYEGYGSSIRRVLEKKNQNPGILGVVADLIEVGKDYEIAIETALGGTIQNIVTDSEETAKEMIRYLKNNRYGRATFLPLSAISAREDPNQKKALGEKGVIGIASDLVTADRRYDVLVRYLLGRVLVVDNIDHAVLIARKYHHSFRMVTLEGESLSPGGSMTGGAFKNTSNLLGRKREIDELTTHVSALKTQIDELQRKIGIGRSERNGMRDRISSLNELLRTKYVEQNTARLEKENLEQKEKELQQGYGRIERDREDLKAKLLGIREDQGRIEQQISESEKDEKELLAYIENRQAELEEWKKEEQECQDRLNEIRLQMAQKTQREQFVNDNLMRISSELDALSEEEKGICASLEQGEDDTKQKREEILRLKENSENLKKESREAEEADALCRREIEEKSRTHKAFFEKRDELSSLIAQVDKECFRLNSQREKIVDGNEQRIAYLWEEYEITPQFALKYRDPELNDRSALKKQVAAHKDTIRKLGPVNVNAIDEYKEVLKRHTFLSGQYDDLKEAEKTLEGIISELDEGMRRQFSEKFRDIQREFDKAFKELFGGGKGSLELIEGDDILEAGILIIAQPPGKKLQNMMQLSGGEKALTAIALLFAIQNLKPSPFCLLDEIEAALDDSNVGRFASYLNKLTKNTQFIIITHRRGTMNAADRLYGITMQEKGVSTLVSVDLVENQLTG